MTVICPNCGGEITAPKKKAKSIKCPHCDMAGLDFGLDYFDEKDNVKQPFSEKHPKLTQAGRVAFAGGCAAFVWWMKNRELFVDKPASEVFTNATSSTTIEPDIDAVANDFATEPLDPNSNEAKERLGQRKMHLRVLVNGQKASPEKQAEANKMNIDLQGKYTLVDECSFHY